MKKKKLKSIKSLQNKAERKWKEYCYLRDGKVCMVKQYAPYLQMLHTDVYQVDHCVSRANKHTFLEVANGTVICSACNFAKNLNHKSVARIVDEIVIKREGIDVYERMVKSDKECGANLNWNKRWWLEEQIEILCHLIEEYKKRR